MITDREIEEKAAEFSIRPNDVEKDYVHGWVLNAISTRPLLASNLVLKGGSALRKGYLPNTRFSKDLDFSAIEDVDKNVLDRELHEVCKLIESQTEVRFLDRTLIKDKNLPIPDVSALEARIYFKGFYNEESVTLKTQLDITEFDRIYLPVQERTLIHPYSDTAACSATIRCHKMEEILASKLTTLLHRQKAVDLFDLLYAIMFATEHQVIRREVISTFLKKSIFEPRPDLAKGALLSVPLEDFRASWSGSILAPLQSLFNFEYVIQNFSTLIESLFGLAVAGVAVGAGGPVAGGMSPIAGRYGARFSTVMPTYFRGDIRNAILAAGRNRQMIELVYDGYTRLVEPYKLEYYVRRGDGRGSEYFWGYDTSGGKSGKISIKQFFCDKIRSAQVTNRSFSPRYAVEL